MTTRSPSIFKTRGLQFSLIGAGLAACVDRFGVCEANHPAGAVALSGSLQAKPHNMSAVPVPCRGPVIHETQIHLMHSADCNGKGSFNCIHHHLVSSLLMPLTSPSWSPFDTAGGLEPSPAVWTSPASSDLSERFTAGLALSAAFRCALNTQPPPDFCASTSPARSPSPIDETSRAAQLPGRRSNHKGGSNA